MPNHKVALIDARLNNGQKIVGTELGPQYLKTDFLFNNLKNLNFPAYEHSIIEEEHHEEKTTFLHNINISSVARTTEKLSSEVQLAISKGDIPVVLGGDHSLAIGSVHGTATALKNLSKIGLIWVDAHADINTPLTSSSGSLHGQPISFLLHELDKYLPKLKEFKWIKEPCVEARHLVYIGLRDLDPEEVILVKKYKIKAYSMSDVDRLGIEQVMKETLEYLTIDGEMLPIHASVDIDSLDPWFAPSTGTAVLGGLTLRELMHIGNSVHKTGKLQTLDLVEVNPMIKSSENDVDKTVFSGVRAILSFFGYETIGSFDKELVLPKP